jgi:hypothetical protein
VTSKRGSQDTGCGSRQIDHDNINYIERAICGEIGADVKLLDRYLGYNTLHKIKLGR